CTCRRRRPGSMIKAAIRSLILACALFACGHALADTGTSSAAKKLPPGFEHVAGAPQTEQLDPNPLVIGAYAMFFVMMFGYVVYVARSQAEIAREMAELAARIAKTEKK